MLLEAGSGIAERTGSWQMAECQPANLDPLYLTIARQHLVTKWEEPEGAYQFIFVI
jgi:hypothetical protein